MTELLDRQEMLQTEADVVLFELNLEPTLRAIGTPVRVGSSALGLMTRRDIDITVVCEVLDASVRNAHGELGRQLLHEQRVRTLRFKNDSGTWNISSKYPDGLYLGIEAVLDGGVTDLAAFRTWMARA